MPLSLSDLPLEYRPKKRATAIVFVLIIVLEMIFAGVFESQAHWPLQAFFTTGLVSTLGFLFMIGACLWGLYDLFNKKDRLTIDETGVTVHLDGKQHAWAWRDMARFHLVTMHAKSGRRLLAIEPFGEMAFDAKAHVLNMRFGPSVEDLALLLREGKLRWGQG